LNKKKKSIKQILNEIRIDIKNPVLFDEAYLWLDKRMPQSYFIRNILKRCYD